MTKFVTTMQLAQELGASDRTIRYWARNGEIPAIRIGRQFRFRRNEIDAWLSSKQIVLHKYQQWTEMDTQKRGDISSK